MKNKIISSLLIATIAGSAAYEATAWSLPSWESYSHEKQGIVALSTLIGSVFAINALFKWYRKPKMTPEAAQIAMARHANLQYGAQTRMAHRQGVQQSYEAIIGNKPSEDTSIEAMAQTIRDFAQYDKQLSQVKKLSSKKKHSKYASKSKLTRLMKELEDLAQK
jgi:hypothetical protein